MPLKPFGPRALSHLIEKVAALISSSKGKAKILTLSASINTVGRSFGRVLVLGITDAWLE